MVRMAEPETLRAEPRGRAPLEVALGEIAGSRHALVLRGPAAALTTVIAALGAEGQEVICSPLGGHAANLAAANATPALADIDRASGCLDPATLETALSSRSRAILAAHAYGQPCDVDAIATVAGRHGLIVIEECTGSLGAVYKGRPAGSLARVAVSRLGDASVLFTGDTALSERAANAARGWFLAEGDGDALLRRLVRLEADIAGRRAAVTAYNRLLGGAARVVPPIVRRDVRAVYSDYVVRVADARQARERLSEAGIDMPMLPALGGRGSGCPNAEEAARSSLALPLYAGMPVSLQAEVARMLVSAG